MKLSTFMLPKANVSWASGVSNMVKTQHLQLKHLTAVLSMLCISALHTILELVYTVLFVVHSHLYKMVQVGNDQEKAQSE